MIISSRLDWCNCSCEWLTNHLIGQWAANSQYEKSWKESYMLKACKRGYDFAWPYHNILAQGSRLWWTNLSYNILSCAALIRRQAQPHLYAIFDACSPATPFNQVNLDKSRCMRTSEELVTSSGMWWSMTMEMSHLFRWSIPLVNHRKASYPNVRTGDRP